MNTVYIVSCPDYGQVEEKMQALLAMMGGMGKFAAKGERIVLKPNLLTAAQPGVALPESERTVEGVAAAFDRIQDRTGETVPQSGAEQSMVILRQLQALGGA